MSHELTRQELYDLAWVKPISKLATKFGVSGVAIAKACRRANIPVPGRGYWARLQHGKAPDRVPLPSQQSCMPHIVQFTPLPARSKGAQIPHDVEEQVRKETDPEQRIIVPKTLANAHPIIRGWLKGTRERPSEVERRRLRILSTLFKELEARGQSMMVDPQQAPTMTIRLGQEKVEFSLREHQRQVRMALIPQEKQDAVNRAFGRESRVELQTTGELVFKIESWIDIGMRKQWRDTSRKRLEDQLNDIIAGLILASASLRRWRLEREDAEHQRIAAEQRRRELEAARLKKEQELRDLLREVDAWQRAAEIRRYAQAVRTAAESGKYATDPEKTEHWAAWAIAIADEIDPLQSKTSSKIEIG